MRVLSWIATLLITVPLTLLGLSLALSNTDIVAWRLWPFADEGLPVMPLGILGVLLLGFGFLCGAAFVSLQAQGWRLRSWQLSRRVTRLEKDLAAVQKPPGDLPALTDLEK